MTLGRLGPRPSIVFRKPAVVWYTPITWNDWLFSSTVFPMGSD